MLLPLLLIALPPAGATGPAALGPLAPEPHHPIVAGIVAAGLTEYHYRERPLDDALSRCWLESYLDDLDPDRSFFTGADIAEFTRFESRLDDLMIGSPPDISPAWTINSRWRSRAKERIQWTRQALKTPPDLTDAESIFIDRSEAAWPPDMDALEDLWRMELEDDWLRLTLDEQDEDAIRDRLSKRMDRLQQNLDSAESGDVLELYLANLAGCFDPHSVYLRPFSAEDFAISTQGSLEGIGAALVEDGDLIRVKEIIAGGPADLSKELLPDDKIVAVAQGDDEWVDVIGMRLDRVVQLIRGPKGTTVRLEIIPADAIDNTDHRQITLVRDRIDLDQVDPKLELHEVADPSGATRTLAVIEVPAFVGAVQAGAEEPRPSTTEQVDALLKANPGVDAVVIDLRQNGGGLLDEAVSLTGLFIDRGPVVRIRDGRGRVERIDDEVRGTSWDGPVVVLTSPYSASASEIFAGALQDYGRALVVGSDSTYGKGSVQTVIPLDEILGGIAPGFAGQNLGGALKITFSQYYLPSGRSTQAQGVPSDIVLPSPFDGRAISEAERDNALPPDAIAPAIKGLSRPIDPLIAGLRQRSAERVATEPGFASIKAWQDLIAQIEEQNETSLVLTERKAELERRKVLRDEIEAATDGEQDVVLDEALAITADLVQQLKGG